MIRLSDMNFKKIFAGFIIAAFIAVISTLAAGGYIFRDKIAFILRYHTITDNYEKHPDDVTKNQLKKFSEDFHDIKDVLILDSGNNITYSAKNSELAKYSAFELGYSDMNHRYLVSSQNSDIMFYLLDSKELYLSLILNEKMDKLIKEHDNESFFLTNIQNKKAYGLSYILNKDTSEKIYFITDIQPVKYANAYFEACELLAAVLLAFYLIIVALWTYQNAKTNRLNAPLWGIITLFTNIIGVLIYAVYKRNIIVCEKCNSIQNKNNIYCTRCQNKLNETCEKCRSIISVHDKYCSHCGGQVKQK